MKELYHVLNRRVAGGLCALALLAACNDDDKVVDTGAPVEAGTPVEATVSIALDNPAGSAHTYSTRAANAASTVKNLWILQYDAAGKCLASVQIDSYTPGQQIKVNLVAGKNLDLYAIAEAGDMSFDNMSLDDLKAASFTKGGGISDLSELPYAGHARVDITHANFRSNDLKLQRIGSQIKIAYVVDPTSPYRITSFQLRNVPKTFRFVSGLPVTADDVEDKEVVSENLEAVHTYIVPENLQGVDESITNAKDKKTDKPATCVEVKGTYEDPTIATTFNSSYRMYLGENNTNDFNLCRNKRYSFVGNLRLEDGEDNRVQTEEVPAPYQQPESNCYMLTPDAVHALAVPVSRVNAFWKSVDSRNELKDDTNDAKITKWVVKVIWQDVEGELIRFDQAEGTRADENFVISPAGKGLEGNVIVGIYDASNGTDIDVKTASPLWSWHIWVTGYNPGDQNWVEAPSYSADAMLDKGDTFRERAAYTVPGGRILQYFSCDQESSAAAKVDYAVMDRNLGALSADKAQFDKTVGFYYQWGRKDPFYAPAGDASKIDYTTDGEKKELAYAVQNPTKFIVAMSNWHTENNNKLWNETGSSYSPKKSIYDPCPAGWMVPYYNVYTAFTVGGESYNVGATSTYSQPYITRTQALPYPTAQAVADAYEQGYLFWPNDLKLWFPAGGYINGKKVQDYKSSGRWWSNYLSNNKGSTYRMQQYDPSEDPYDNYYHFYMCVNEGIGSNQSPNVAQPVRCVMEKK